MAATKARPWVSGGGHIATLAITPHMTPGYKATAARTHYSLLWTIEQAWGLPHLGRAASASRMEFPYQPVSRSSWRICPAPRPGVRIAVAPSES